MKALIDRILLIAIATLAAALILAHLTPAFGHGAGVDGVAAPGLSGSRSPP